MRTGVVATFADHPVVEFIRQGMLVTINTDDPKMFNNTLADEYTLLMTEGGLHEADICALIDNAIRASWLSDAEKTALRAQMHAHPDWC
jgi:adenosine deaminase